MDYTYFIGIFVIILIVIYIIFILYCTYVWKIDESLENRMIYAGQDLRYNNNPRNPNYPFTTFDDNSLLVPNPNVYKNKNLYSIDF